MVQVPDRVFEHWRGLEARGDELAIVMLFRSGLSRREAISVLEQAAGDVMRDRTARFAAPPGGDERSTGHWSLAPVPGGVAMRIDEEPDDFEGLVRAIVAQLESAGVEGSFDLYKPDAVIDLPEAIDLLECRLRVRGERFHYRGPNWGWRAEPDAMSALVAASVDWCVANDPLLPLSLVVRLLAPAFLGPDDDVHAYVRQALELSAELGVVQLTSVDPHRFRTVAVDASKGRVTLIEGGDRVRDRWQPSLHSLRAQLDAAAPLCVYGFIKRGSYRPAAVQGASLSQDWVPVLHFLVNSAIGEAFENEYVPDMFGVQLLGAGYAGRVPAAPEWKHAAVDASIVVEHVDPSAWFDDGLVRFGGPLSPAPAAASAIPAVVAAARADFAHILFRDDIAWGR